MNTTAFFATLFAGLKDVAIRALTSLKVWTAIVGLLTTWMAAKGYVMSIDPTLVAGFFGVLLLGQASNDHGAKAAQIYAAREAVRDAAIQVKPERLVSGDGTMSLHMNDGTSHDITAMVKSVAKAELQQPLPRIDLPVAPTTTVGEITVEGNIVGTKTVEGGFVRFAIMFVIASMAAAMLVLGGCSAAAGCKVSTSTKCNVINDILDCTKGETPAIIAEFAPILFQLIEQFMGADGSVDWTHINLTTIPTAEAVCILTSLDTTKPKLVAGEVHPALSDKIKELKIKAGVVTVHVDGGDR